MKQSQPELRGKGTGTSTAISRGTWYDRVGFFKSLIQNVIVLFGTWNGFLELLIILAYNMIGCIQDLVYGIKTQHFKVFPNGIIKV